jgi:UDP-N-acetylmuramoyl-L-alanyl-D-glutamate--2,6-diaminopimelate ligase
MAHDLTLASAIRLAGLPVEHLAGDAAITGVSDDSRDVSPGDLFVCMPGARVDSHEFLSDAKAAGATAAIVRTHAGEHAAREAGLPFVHIADEGNRFVAAIGLLCRVIYGDPTLRLRMIGITGTNGKTTTAWMVRDALASLGRRAAYLGTLGFKLPSGETRSLKNTTPFPVALWRLLTEAEAAGAQDVVMESSSHALLQRRLAGVRYDVGCFTNLSQDHLDYHKTMESYAAAKKLLFTEYAMAGGKPFIAAVNETDPYGAAWLDELPTKAITFGKPQSDIWMEVRAVRVDAIDAALNGEYPFSARVGGHFNVDNLAAAAGVLAALGYGPEASARALAEASPAPGRFEAVTGAGGVGVIVDYAHTPDALAKLLDSARQLRPSRMIVVFGCGGDRDRNKRPKMAAAVAARADLAIVTSDNPRSEDPEAIIADIVEGLPPDFPSEAIVDRREAVRRAVALAESGDLVVIAGKGHEDYQEIDGERFPMDDRVLAREALEAR